MERSDVQVVRHVFWFVGKEVTLELVSGADEHHGFAIVCNCHFGAVNIWRFGVILQSVQRENEVHQCYQAAVLGFEGTDRLA